MVPSVIKKLKKMKFGQNVSSYGPKEHIKKQGTPTMGGVIFLLATLIVSIPLLYNSKEGRLLILGMLLFGMIGFIDDYIMIRKKRAVGLNAKAKILLNILFGVVMGYLLYTNFGLNGNLNIPIVKTQINLGMIPYILFIVLFYTSVTNSVNLSDGVDGLCASLSSVVTIFYIVYALTKASNISGNYEIALFAAILLGALLAYLFFNWHPARVFMGDTGSFAIGGALGTLAVLTKTEILFILIGLIFVIESLSDIIQIGSVKLRKGKRVFLMAPIHHHYEKKGWKENKIVGSFALFTLICCVIAYFLG